MSDRVGLVACSSLIAEVDILDGTPDVQYVPHALHESPFDPGDEGAMVDTVHRAIATLVDRNVDRIALAYATSGPDLVPRDRQVPIAQWQVDDCVSGLRENPVGAGDGKKPRTYYLTRGSIDRGIDPYKLYLGYRDEVDVLVDWFKEQSPGDRDGCTEWSTGDRFRSLVAGSDGAAARSVLDDYFADQLGYFDRIVLIDSGTSRPLHHAYAARFARFVESLTGDTVEVEVETGSIELLSALVHEWEDASQRHRDLIEVHPPTNG